MDPVVGLPLFALIFILAGVFCFAVVYIAGGDEFTVGCLVYGGTLSFVIGLALGIVAIMLLAAAA